MSEVALIRETLRRAAARRRLESALRGLWTGLLTGSALWLLAVVAFKLLPLPDLLPAWAWTAAPAGALLGFILGGRNAVSLDTAARVLEARHPLNQRLSTALEISRTDAATQPTNWTRLVVTDAAAAIRDLDLRKLLPIGIPAFARWIPVLVVLVVGLGFVPEYRSATHLRRKQEAAIIQDTGRKMAELIRQELERRAPDADPVRDALDETGALGDRLAQPRLTLTKADALRDLQNTRERLENEARQLDNNPALQRLQQAARSPSAGSGSDNSPLQKQLEKLQQSLGTNAKPDALDKLAENLAEARKSAAGMQGDAPDAASRQALSQSLANLAQTARDMGLPLAGLDQALQAFENLQIDRVLQDLQQAGAELDKFREMAQSLASMQQQMEQLGKDLAEQLERGQAEAAARTLEEMARQLDSAGLTPGQIEKLTAEVTKALQPSSQYGKAGDALREAAARIQSGDKSDASRKLAQAAEELRKMARQAEDLQQLAEALAALDDAQLAIQSGKEWKPGTCKGGACTGCGLHPNGRPGFGKGGRPGRGVGTWAEESGWLYYPERSERWDNSGINRPDMASRGHTDRGDGRLAENLAPTRVKGQISPGPMPSISLKGVSIKGTSSVQYQEAVSAAQSDAQSALNQDQIPRSYRNTVKGYFDDLE